MLAISAVSISNLALVKLGQEPISSLSQDTKNARLCNAVFEACRNEVLEAHPWQFATKTVEMASVDGVEDELEQWAYLYQLPADHLKPVYVEDETEPYEIRDGYLMCDTEPANFKYIYENTNPQQWSHSFAMCLSWRIAAEISYACTQSSTVRKEMMEGFEMSLRVARYHDANKQGSTQVLVDDILAVRS